jgi:hypothetical protein
MLFLVSVDRFYAVFRPLSYFARSTSYAWKMFAALMAFTALHVLVSGTMTFFAERKLESPAFCYPANGVSAAWFNQYLSISRIIAPLISVVLYYFIARRVRQVNFIIHYATVVGGQTWAWVGDLDFFLRNLIQFSACPKFFCCLVSWFVLSPPNFTNPFGGYIDIPRPDMGKEGGREF